MVCPDCGGDIASAYSARRDDKIIRKKVCKKCFKELYTIEVFAPNEESWRTCQKIVRRQKSRNNMESRRRVEEYHRNMAMVAEQKS